MNRLLVFILMTGIQITSFAMQPKPQLVQVPQDEKKKIQNWYEDNSWRWHTKRCIRGRFGGWMSSYSERRM